MYQAVAIYRPKTAGVHVPIKIILNMFSNKIIDHLLPAELSPNPHILLMTEFNIIMPATPSYRTRPGTVRHCHFNHSSVWASSQYS